MTQYEYKPTQSTTVQLFNHKHISTDCLPTRIPIDPLTPRTPTVSYPPHPVSLYRFSQNQINQDVNNNPIFRNHHIKTIHQNLSPAIKLTLNNSLIYNSSNYFARMQQEPEVIFANLKSSDEPYFVDSLCVQCFKTGRTTMLLTNIPFFREIVVVAFYCEECGFKNSEIQFGGQLADQGVKIKFNLQQEKDLNREIIKSEHATILIPEIEFEIPSNKKGEITTVEGLIDRCIDEISREQPVRKVVDQHLYEKIEEFLAKTADLKTSKGLPFTLIIDDPSGLSFIKNPFAPKTDPQVTVELFNRTIEQIEAMGYSVENARQNLQSEEQKKTEKLPEPVPQAAELTAHRINLSEPLNEEEMLKQPIVFDVECHSCGLMGETKMCETTIPYFKNIVIMSFICDHCGAHSTETKTSGGIQDYGMRITIKNPDATDLKRDLFKSDTCAVNIPELQLQLDYGTLGGVYTTLQGLLEKIHNHLDEHNPFADSDKQFGTRMKRLLDELTECRMGERQFTIILTDPLAHSFMQNPYHPNPDTKILVEKFERDEEQNDFLGITNMKVENYC